MSVALREFDNPRQPGRGIGGSRFKLPPHPNSTAVRSHSVKPTPHSHSRILPEDYNKNALKPIFHGTSNQSIWEKMDSATTDCRDQTSDDRRQHRRDSSMNISRVLVNGGNGTYGMDPAPLPSASSINMSNSAPIDKLSSASQRINQLTKKLSQSSTNMASFKNISPFFDAPILSPQPPPPPVDINLEILVNAIESLDGRLANLDRRLSNLETSHSTTVDELANVLNEYASNAVQQNDVKDLHQRLESLECIQQDVGRKMINMSEQLNNIRMEVQMAKDSQKSPSTTDQTPGSSERQNDVIIRNIQNTVEQLLQSERSFVPFVCDELRSTKEQLNEERKLRMDLEEKILKDLGRISPLLMMARGDETASSMKQQMTFNTEKELRKILKDTCTKLESLRCGEISGGVHRDS